MAVSEQDRTTRERKPLDSEVDVFGLTHPGKVRKTNQDHFLICSMRKQLDIHLTSLSDVSALPIEKERLAFLAMVADGVGGGAMGEKASRIAVEAVTQHIAQSMHCYYTADATDDETFASTLEDGALRVHEAIRQQAEQDSDLRGMATTLTMYIGVWPKAYLLQIGDSRCYVMRDRELTQITRDQTMAQELVDQGVLTRTDAFHTRWAHVLSSSLGGQQTAPVVTTIELKWGHIVLLCSDGLTKHVSDERIRERLLHMTSAKKTCEELLQDALDDGGTDNITVLVGRAVKREVSGGAT